MTSTTPDNTLLSADPSAVTIGLRREPVKTFLYASPEEAADQRDRWIGQCAYYVAGDGTAWRTIVHDGVEYTVAGMQNRPSVEIWQKPVGAPRSQPAQHWTNEQTRSIIRASGIGGVR